MSPSTLTPVADMIDLAQTSLDIFIGAARVIGGQISVTKKMVPAIIYLRLRWKIAPRQKVPRNNSKLSPGQNSLNPGFLNPRSLDLPQWLI